jgi:histidine triad (HIT) family protein
MSTQADCIFCKIIERKLPANIVYETDSVIAFHDIHPVAPVHILIIPKKHIPTMNDVTIEDLSVVADIHRAAQEIAKQFGVAESGYRLVNNCNRDGGQVVYHIHYHLLGGEPIGGLRAQ